MPYHAHSIDDLFDIPEDTTHVTFSDIPLHDEDLEAVVAAVRQLPESVTTLDLSNDALGYCDSAFLLALFLAMPRHLKTLLLATNNLSVCDAVLLQDLFAALPPHLQTLGLMDNDFGQCDPYQFCAALRLLPHDMQCLDLRRNGLSLFDKAALCSVCANLPGGLLGLVLDGLTIEHRAKFGAFFAVLPASISMLDLNTNDFGSWPVAQLNALLRRVPKTVETLDLSRNTLNRVTANDLVALRGALPHVKTIYLGYYDVNSMTPAQRAAWRDVFPAVCMTYLGEPQPAGYIFFGKKDAATEPAPTTNQTDLARLANHWGFAVMPAVPSLQAYATCWIRNERQTNPAFKQEVDRWASSDTVSTELKRAVKKPR